MILQELEFVGGPQDGMVDKRPREVPELYPIYFFNPIYFLVPIPLPLVAADEPQDLKIKKYVYEPRLDTRGKVVYVYAGIE